MKLCTCMYVSHDVKPAKFRVIQLNKLKRTSPDFPISHYAVWVTYIVYAEVLFTNETWKAVKAKLYNKKNLFEWERLFRIYIFTLYACPLNTLQYWFQTYLYLTYRISSIKFPGSLINFKSPELRGLISFSKSK